MQSKALIYGLVAVFVFILAAVGGYIFLQNNAQPPYAGIGTNYEPPIELTDFSMTANNGQNMRLSDLKGKPSLLFFGYTHCPDVCPTTLLTYMKVKENMGADADKINFVFITVDPERDTPELMNRYLQRYDPSFIGLSGDTETLDQIKGEYGLFFEIRQNTVSDAGYLVDHTASKFLLDAEGRLIRLYSFTSDPQTLADELKDLLST